MNRADFMDQLESLLQSIAPTEREEAIQYYNDYFDDAGKENEQEEVKEEKRIHQNTQKNGMKRKYMQIRAKII